MESKLCGILFKQINDALYKNANNKLRKDDLTLSQIMLLSKLDQMPGESASMKDLEKILQVAQSTTVGIVARLEQKGFVESYGDAVDRRIKRVHLTVAGKHCCRKADSHMDMDEQWLLHGFSAEEREQFYSYLKRAHHNVTNIEH